MNLCAVSANSSSLKNSLCAGAKALGPKPTGLAEADCLMTLAKDVAVMATRVEPAVNGSAPGVLSLSDIFSRVTSTFPLTTLLGSPILRSGRAVREVV